MVSRMVLSIVDYDNDRMQLSFEGATSSAGTYAADLAAAEALADALEGITLAERVYRDFVANRDAVTPVISASNPFSQTNIQWDLNYTDNVTGTEYHTRIGCADLSISAGVIGGVNYIDLTAGVGATLKTAFEAYVKSPAGNAVTLESVTFHE